MAADQPRVAIAACIAACADAENGHVRRWARARLERDLRAAGSTPAVAAAVAAGADAVGRRLGELMPRAGGLDEQVAAHGAMVSRPAGPAHP